MGEVSTRIGHYFLGDGVCVCGGGGQSPLKLFFKF